VSARRFDHGQAITKLQAMAEEREVEATIAHDGMTLVLR
jgi:hypothetical protein